MTAKKDLKRLVRARARKTGESYAAALAHFGKEIPDSQRSATGHRLRRIEQSGLGFALRVPDSWKELSPDLRNSPWEVARFSGSDPTAPAHHTCLVFRHPAPPGVDAHVAARNARPALEANGFGSFAQTDAVVAGRPGARLDFDRPADGGLWAVRNYYVVVDDVTFCLAFGTSAPGRAAALLDSLASGFELIGGLAGAAAREAVDSSPRLSEKPEYGFSLRLPERWIERPPYVKSNPWEVARFVEAGDGRHLCSVTRRPSADRTGGEVAEEDLESLAARGFSGFRLTTATLADRPAVRLDFEERDAGRVWAVRHYYLAADGITFILHLGTAMPERDATLFDGLAAGFGLLPSARPAAELGQ